MTRTRNGVGLRAWSVSVVVVLSTLASNACSKSVGPVAMVPTDPTVMPASSRASVPTEPSSTPPAEQSGALVLTCPMYGGAGVVAHYPGGEQVVTLPVTYPTGIGDVMPVCGHGALSPDLTKVAVASGSQPDGSTHVGWVDISTGEFHDVSAANAETGFGATPTQDGGAMFDQTDGSFWYYTDQSQVLTCASGSTLCDVVGTPETGLDAFNGARFDVSAGFWRFVKGVDLPAMNPSHTLVATGGLDRSIEYYMQVWAPLHDTIDPPDGTPSFHTVLNGDPVQVSPLLWVSDADLLVSGFEDNALYLLTGLRAGAAADTPLRVVVPSSQQTFGAYAVSADHSMLAFTARVSDAAPPMLYTEPLGAGAGGEPTSVAEISGSGEVGTNTYLLSYRP